VDYQIHLKRVYDTAEKGDGARILVDRLWPRGKRREDLHLSDWYKDASPSPGLRRAWHKEDIDEKAFIRDYGRELEANPDSLVPLMKLARAGRLTLLTATRNPEQSHLPVLRQALLDALQREDSEADGCDPSSPVCYEK
jgi:uncharacterized protein YeaO (DUF488 family)